MPLLTIRLKKNRDGTVALSCTRADGSVTWQRVTAAHAGFFPLHDLSHYAVETVLGHRRGFYGLVADGWDFQDFGTPWPRGPIPADADPSELIVGLLDAERAMGTAWSAADLAEQAAQFYAQYRISTEPLVTEIQLADIRGRRDDLFARWEAVPPGDTLELVFDSAVVKV